MDIPWHNWLVLGSDSPNIFCELRDHQEVLNMDIPWHNWLVLGSDSPNIFCFVLFGIIRLQETYKNIL
jgi:hypothetical protein